MNKAPIRIKKNNFLDSSFPHHKNMTANVMLFGVKNLR